MQMPWILYCLLLLWDLRAQHVDPNSNTPHFIRGIFDLKLKFWTLGKNSFVSVEKLNFDKSVCQVNCTTNTKLTDL